MGDQPVPGMASEIPDIKKPDLQMLFQDLAQARRDVFEERRNTDRMVAAERDRARWESDKLRAESAEKVRGLERENEAIVRALGRLQGEVDRMREESAILRGGHVHQQAGVSPQPQKGMPAQDMQGPALLPPMGMGLAGGPTKSTKATIMGASEPPLGKTIPIDPTKL